MHDNDEAVIASVLDAVRVPRLGRGRPKKRPRCVVADRGYSYKKCRCLLRGRCLVPERRDQQARRRKKGRSGGRPCRFDKEQYRRRNVVERTFLRLKQFRRVATRYDKLAQSYLAWATLASIRLWLR